jgi:hypothetical protein
MNHGSECVCGLPVLDGQLTCGQARCGTQAEAEARWRASGAPFPMHPPCIFCGSPHHRTSACPELP